VTIVLFTGLARPTSFSWGLAIAASILASAGPLDYVANPPERDRRVTALQVVGATERTVQLRALVSAQSSSLAGNLRCKVREHLIAPCATTSRRGRRAPGSSWDRSRTSPAMTVVAGSGPAVGNLTT
jgi:hypothetical protein